MPGSPVSLVQNRRSQGWWTPSCRGEGSRKFQGHDQALRRTLHGQSGRLAHRGGRRACAPLGVKRQRPPFVGLPR